MAARLVVDSAMSIADVGDAARAARDGDRAALERFLTAIEPDVWCFCFHVGPVARGAKLAQVAMLRIVTDLHRWEDGPVSIWALRVTRSACRDRGTRWWWRSDSVPIGIDRETSPGHDAAETTSWLLRSLPVELREVIVLTQLIGLSYAETGDVVGCSALRIRSQVAAGRSILAEGLRGRGG